MVRMQVHLTEEQAGALKRLARIEGRSVASLIRSAVEALLRSRGRLDQQVLRERARDLAGRFRSGEPDLGEGHDRHLEEAFRR